MNKKIRHIFIMVNCFSVLFIAYTLLNKCAGRLFMDNYCMPDNNYFVIVSFFKNAYLVLFMVSLIAAFYFCGHLLWNKFADKKQRNIDSLNDSKYLLKNFSWLLILSLVIIIISITAVSHYNTSTVGF